ncbi:hypothetical protein C8J56DRAFT_1161211 [Mycena floridula]|nr:hypothetical protein C8J56DRAFT_1161211 [Mycena floridula]
MGLADRKTKQRIAVDPRNLTWADDASKFGQSYLSKFGWDTSKGLGLEGDGRKTHVKVAQKLDMFGIGAAHQKDPNGTAWKQNKDFESLLKRLNDEPTPEKTEKKRKHSEDGDEDKAARKKRRKEEKARLRAVQEEAVEEQPVAEEPVAEPKARPAGRRRAHRARAIAAKSISSKSAAQISEILGVASSEASTSVDQGPKEPIISLEKLTTSTKSVADYFKERLQAKQQPQRPVEDVDDDDDDAPRGGLGSSRMRDTGIMSTFSSLLSSTILSTIPSSEPEPELSEKEKKKKDKEERRERRRLKLET